MDIVDKLLLNTGTTILNSKTTIFKVSDCVGILNKENLFVLTYIYFSISILI